MAADNNSMAIEWADKAIVSVMQLEYHHMLISGC